MSNFEKIERPSLSELLNVLNELDINKWEILGHPQSYVEDNYVESGSFGGEGLRELTPRNIFYVFVKNKDMEKIVV